MVKRPRRAGSVASFMANIDTVPPGIKPIPPVSSALAAPSILKKFHFFYELNHKPHRLLERRQQWLKEWMRLGLNL